MGVKKAELNTQKQVKKTKPEGMPADFILNHRCLRTSTCKRKTLHQGTKKENVCTFPACTT
jgi:hypothetical protein